MGIEYLKRAPRRARSGKDDVTDAVGEMLRDIAKGGDTVACDYARRFDGWDGPIVVSPDEITAAERKVPERLRDDIAFAHDNVRRFAQAQRATVQDCELEVIPGLLAGQKQIPVQAAGCYVPGGRYSHIASAIMTVTTAKVAGVQHIAAASPPRPGEGIPAPILFAMDLCGADKILNLGGVQGVAAMAGGLFGLPAADIVVGPGNQYVAEAKRILYGQIGIDMFAGPTDLLIVADETADPEMVAFDLVGQAEHGYNSPVWLVTSHRPLAEAVLNLVPNVIASLPELNAQSAQKAWEDYAEVMVASDRDQMVRTANDYAPEHLHVQAADLDWYLENLAAYGSLFLGEETTVAFGDKSSGPNHVLPTSGAARYTGGLSVHKFMKTVTWQRSTREAAKPIAQATARISRLEGMEAHARTADIRLARFFPDESFDLGI